VSASRLVAPFVSLLLGASTLGVIYALDQWGGLSIIEFFLVPGLLVGTLLSGGGPHAGNGLIWFVCLIVVNVMTYSYLWWLVVRRLPLPNARQS
jgi:hypothetical protein